MERKMATSAAPITDIFIVPAALAAVAIAIGKTVC